jgi:6-phosphogluconolactonase (cycloisomerase 2 family)
VAGIAISSLTATGTFKGSSSDTTSSGLAVVNNGKYVYAGFTGSGTIGTYQMLSGCKLQFLADTPAVGLGGSPVLDMAAVKSILVVSFQDGSIESFNISAGVAVANGDLQYSTGHAQNNFVAGVDIDATAHYAAFGGTANPAVIEVSDISSGKLTPTVVYSNLGPNTGSEAIWFSPDDQWLYFSGFNSGKITAANFNNSTGSVTAGCTSSTLKGGNDQAGLATALPSGDGSIIYVAEPETSVGIVRISQSKPACELIETAKSPVHDGNTITLESVGVFPPRRF